MRIQEAIKRLSFTISKQNKPNNTDADALNSIIEFLNLSGFGKTKSLSFLINFHSVLIAKNLLFITKVFHFWLISFRMKIFW
jgi:hypothetical protein